MAHQRNVHERAVHRHPCDPEGVWHKYAWASWLGPLVGLVSLLWFLLRVIPKPSRATYPCQRAAAPLASGFIIWLLGLVASTLAYRRARALYRRARYFLAGILAAAGIVVIWLAVGATTNNNAGAGLMPDDPPNTPIGAGKGIYPGRVVWVYEPAATLWDGQTDNWWDDANTDERLVDAMVSVALRALTGERNDATAWNTLFRQFNRTHGSGNTGYRTGEKVAIKLNMNQDRDTDSDKSWRQGAGMPSPHVVHALLKQLIEVAGVAGRDITLYDASKYIGDPLYENVRADPDAQFQEVRFVVVPAKAQNGREPAGLDVDHFVQFADPSLPNQARAYLPVCVTEARYLINMALLRGHGTYGVTFTAKNHFGSMRFPDSPWGPGPLHNYGSLDVPPGTYSCLVDLIGSAHLGGKTLLYLMDALYPAVDNSGDVIRFKSFGNDWCSSLFASQDPVAIDSVGFDFLRDEPESLYVQRGRGLDYYLHEAAQADHPPSGIFYNPDGDGLPLQSLGVHEHWNNPVERQYSRNLGTGLGIELVAIRPTSRGGYMSMARTDLTGNGFIDACDVATFAQTWLSHPGDPQWLVQCDFSSDGQVNFSDLAWLFDGWESWTQGQGPQVD